MASCWATTTSLSQYAQLPTCLCQQSSWQTLWKIINGSSTAVAHTNHISIPEYMEYFRVYTCTDLKNQGATMQGKWYRHAILTCVEAVETINIGLAQAHPNKALHVAVVSCTELVYYFECMKLQLTSTCCTLRKFWGYKNFMVPCKPWNLFTCRHLQYTHGYTGNYGTSTWWYQLQGRCYGSLEVFLKMTCCWDIDKDPAWHSNGTCNILLWKKVKQTHKNNQPYCSITHAISVMLHL